MLGERTTPTTQILTDRGIDMGKIVPTPDQLFVAFYCAAFRYFREKGWKTSHAIKQATAYAAAKTK